MLGGVERSLSVWTLSMAKPEVLSISFCGHSFSREMKPPVEVSAWLAVQRGQEGAGLLPTRGERLARIRVVACSFHVFNFRESE